MNGLSGLSGLSVGQLPTAKGQKFIDELALKSLRINLRYKTTYTIDSLRSEQFTNL